MTSRINYLASTSTFGYVYEKAGEYYANGNYGDALILYRELMSSGVDDDLYYNAACCCEKMNNLDQAADYLEKSLKLNDRRFDGFVLLAEIYNKNGDFTKSIYNYTRARALKPDYTAGCLALSDLYKYKLMNFESIYYKNKFLQFTKDKKTHQYRNINQEVNRIRLESGRYSSNGMRAYSRGDLYTARQELVNAVRIYPLDYDTNYTIARVCNDLGENSEASKYFIRALFLNSSNTQIYMYLASVYSKMRDYTRAYCFTKRYLDLLLPNHNQQEYLKTIKTLKSLEPYAVNNIAIDKAENYISSNRYFEGYLEYQNIKIISKEDNSEVDSRLQLLELMSNPESYWAKLYLKKGQSLYNAGNRQEANNFFSRVMEISLPASAEYKSAKSKLSYV